jgi:pimeloyl-ACP methyl ester carboxylesterase
MAVQELRHPIRDIRVRLFRDGQGSRVVYLHGAGGIPGWIPMFERLAERHELLVPEHPGFGNSDLPGWIRNVADMAYYYLDFFEAMQAEDLHLVGFSLGGWIAAELAVRNCSRLRSLTLIAPAGIRIKGLATGDNFIWSPEEAARNLFHDQSYAELMLTQTLSEDEQDRQLANRYMAARLGWEPRWFNPDLERWLHRIKVPTLVLWGGDDRLFPAAFARRWGERVPGARVEVVPDCGHLLPIEKGEWAAQQILTFIAGT